MGSNESNESLIEGEPKAESSIEGGSWGTHDRPCRTPESTAEDDITSVLVQLR